VCPSGLREINFKEPYIMSKNEKSSKELASLAGKVLQQQSSTQAAKKLAGSVLTQAADKKNSGGGKKGK
jgi:hypothetical protein